MKNKKTGAYGATPSAAITATIANISLAAAKNECDAANWTTEGAVGIQR